MGQFGDIYAGRKVLITGHTGFKGSWLALWLETLGAEVIGVALPPEKNPNHWDLLNLPIKSYLQDIREFNKLNAILKSEKPEIVFHLAAQPLVRRSYKDPLETWSTNVMGGVNLLEACRESENLKAIVYITTDKVYKEQEHAHHACCEDDHLGGHDPYSASKAANEILAASYRQSFFSDEKTPLLATARAGNVIGGGDWSEDRLIPDIIRSVEKKESVVIRNPEFVRPWQYVLESLSGYLLLGQRLLEGRKELAAPWNFGPKEGDVYSVSALLEKMKESWADVSWSVRKENHLHESRCLMLDCTKAQKDLAWKSVLSVDQAIRKTTEWYKEFIDARTVASKEHLNWYIEQARKSGQVWIID